MYKNIKRLYDSGKITEAGVKEAFKRNWITQEQHDEILGIFQEPEVEDAPETSEELEEELTEDGPTEDTASLL